MKQTLWTIQHEDAWAECEKTGVLRANEKYLFCQEDFREAYDWMARQLSRRVGEAPEHVRYPVWAWYKWEGMRKRRDLRFGGYAARGTPMVQLTFEADDSQILLSEFDEWHLVMMGAYIACSEKEWNDFENISPPDNQMLKEKSWERIFELEPHDWKWSVPIEKQWVQAVLWEIKMDQIQKVEHFIAK